MSKPKNSNNQAATKNQPEAAKDKSLEDQTSKPEPSKGVTEPTGNANDGNGQDNTNDTGTGEDPGTPKLGENGLAPTRTTEVVVPEGENPLVSKETVSPLVEGLTSPADEAAPIFQLAFSLADLAENLDVGLLTIQKALDERLTQEGVEFPEFLIGFQLNGKVLERYVAGVRSKEVPLEEAELVIADPATDPVLKSLNFVRYLQGLTDTHLYLRFL